MKHLLLLLSFIGFINSQNSWAQNDTLERSQLDLYEDTLIVYADSIRFSILPIEKAEFNEKFSVLLKKVLEMPESLKHPFSRLKNHIHIIEPDDKSFRIFNWLVIVSEYQRKYYGIIQMLNNSESPILFPLIDKSVQLEESNNALSVVSNKEWYGCEFYNILTLKLKNGSKIYALFGYNNNAIQSKKKILDHLYFTESGPMLGLPIIETPNGVINRLIIEYKKEADVSLNYNKEEKKVIFDRTHSEIGDPKKRYTYVPTGNLDGFEWKNDKWNFVMDAVPILYLQDGQAPIDGVFRNR